MSRALCPCRYAVRFGDDCHGIPHNGLPTMRESPSLDRTAGAKWNPNLTMKKVITSRTKAVAYAVFSRRHGIFWEVYSSASIQLATLAVRH